MRYYRDNDDVTLSARNGTERNTISMRYYRNNDDVTLSARYGMVRNGTESNKEEKTPMPYMYSTRTAVRQASPKPHTKKIDSAVRDESG